MFPCTSSPSAHPSLCPWTQEGTGQLLSRAGGSQTTPQYLQSLHAARRRGGSVSRLRRCPAEGHGSSWMLCPALGTCRGRSSSAGLLPTEMAFLESSACCRLAAPGAPAAPWPPHQRCHQPEGERGGGPAAPGLLPSLPGG